MKVFLSLSGLLFNFHILFSQSLPAISEDDFLQKQDLKKKIGWIKIQLDENFRETDIPSQAQHVYYDFADKDGNLISTYRAHMAFPNNTETVSYQPAKEGDANPLIDGTLTFIKKKGGKIAYQIRQGFILKIFEYNSDGNLITAIEYLPGKTSVELYANYFNKDGSKIEFDSHESYDGMKYTTLAGSKDIK